MCWCVFRVCVSQSLPVEVPVSVISFLKTYESPKTLYHFSCVHLYVCLRRGFYGIYLLHSFFLFISELGEIENDGSRNRRFLVCGCRLACVPIPLGSTSPSPVHVVFVYSVRSHVLPRLSLCVRAVCAYARDEATELNQKERCTTCNTPRGIVQKALINGKINERIQHP